MKLSTNVIAQLLATAVQVLNQVTPAVPDKYKYLAAAALGFLQLVIGVIAHNSNPDGTSSLTAYVPPEKK